MRRRVVVALLVVVGVLFAGSPASAGGHKPITPRQFCLDVYETRTEDSETLTAHWVPIRYEIENMTMVIDLPILSLQGCISTVARGLQHLRAHGWVPADRLSMPAALSQCAYLEELGITYPYAFYGTYVAHNRAQCAQILVGLHTGRLTPMLPPEQGPPVE
jgi:hypothetical protein